MIGIKIDKIQTSKKLRENITDYVRDYLNKYHPAGYGTKLKGLEYDSDNFVTLIFERFTSCD